LVNELRELIAHGKCVASGPAIPTPHTRPNPLSRYPLSHSGDVLTVRFYCSVFFIAQDTLGVHFSKLREHVTCAHLVFFRTTAQPSQKKVGQQSHSDREGAKCDCLLRTRALQEIQH
jgi:hypothetical protein